MTKLFMKLAPVSINFYRKQINIFSKDNNDITCQRQLYVLSNILYFKRIVGNIGIVHIGLFCFLYFLYHIVGEWQSYYFIPCFQGCLGNNKHQQSAMMQYTGESNAKEYKRVGTFAHYG